MFIPYIHNDWLQLAIETGWIGGVLFVLAMGSLAVRILRRWWQTKERWGFGFGLAAMGAMIGTGIHALLDFGLRIPVNAIFLVLLAALALTTLDDGFRRKTGLHQSRLLPKRYRLFAGFCLLIGTLLCVWLAVQTGRYALAQRYCPTEIDTVGNRSEFGVSAAKLQGALQLNPLNGEYWLDLAISIRVGGCQWHFRKDLGQRGRVCRQIGSDPGVGTGSWLTGVASRLGVLPGLRSFPGGRRVLAGLGTPPLGKASEWSGEVERQTT